MAKITEKQKRFCNEYLTDLNATAAAKRAGYKDPNIGRQLITKNNVSEYIEQRMELREKRTEITQDRVLKELASIGFADIADFAKIEEKEFTDPDSGNTRKYKGVELIMTDDIPSEKRGAVAGIKQGANGIEIKLNDKVKALELMGKHLGLFTEKVEVNGQIDTGADKLNNILEQLKNE